MSLYFNLEGMNVSAKELVTDRLIEQRNKCSKSTWKKRMFMRVREHFMLTLLVLWQHKYTDNSTCPFLKLSAVLSCSPMATWPVVHGPWFNTNSWLRGINRINQSARSSIYEDSSLCSLRLEQCLDDCMRKLRELFMMALWARSQRWFVMGLDLINRGCDRHVSPAYLGESLLLFLVAQAVSVSTSLIGKVSVLYIFWWNNIKKEVANEVLHLSCI